MSAQKVRSPRLMYISINAVVLLMLILASCAMPSAPGSTGQASSSSGQPVTLTYWNGFTASDRPVMEGNVAEFNKTHPNIQIKMDIQPWDTIFQKLLPSLKAGSEPDIVSLGGDVLPQYAAAGVLTPVDDLWAGGGLDPKNFSDGVIKGMSFQGHMYGAPIIYFTTLMYRNKDLFKAAGLDPEKCPADWKEWEADILALTKDGNNDGKPEQYGFAWGDHGAVSMWPAIVWGGGGDFVNADGTKSMLDDPKTIAAIKEWTDLIKDKHILALGLSGVEADNLFQTGKAAMEIVGPWVSTGFKDAGINFDICQIPAGPAGRFTQGNGVYMTINKNSKHKEAAYELLKFWQQEWAQINWSSKTGFPPTQPAFASNAEIKKNPYVQAFADSAPYARTYLPGVVQFAKLDGDIITPAILSIARGEKPAEDALKEAAAKMNEVLAAK
ncbi:MAG: ABC transporter substrate-binding protein [Caldilineaceae bacterium]